MRWLNTVMCDAVKKRRMLKAKKYCRRRSDDISMGKDLPWKGFREEGFDGGFDG